METLAGVRSLPSAPASEASDHGSRTRVSPATWPAVGLSDMTKDDIQGVGEEEYRIDIAIADGQVLSCSALGLTSMAFQDDEPPTF